MADTGSFNNNDDDEIWDEHKWEEFMRESDKRTEKYTELFEKYLDHPDRDIIIAKEMGWDWLDEALEDEDSDTFDERNPDILEAYFDTFDEVEEGESWKKGTDYDEFDGLNFKDSPLYQLAYDYGIDVSRYLNTLPDENHDESIQKWVSSALITSAKIAGSFGMGFEMDTLGGNIANCKRGLTAANHSLEGLQEMRQKNLIDEESYLDFHRRGKEVRDELGMHISELRSIFKRGFL